MSSFAFIFCIACGAVKRANAQPTPPQVTFTESLGCSEFCACTCTDVWSSVSKVPMAWVHSNSHIFTRQVPSAPPDGNGPQ